MELFEPKPKSSINLAFFTDERKNISGTWNYISTIIVPTEKFNSLYDTLMKHRKELNYYGELKYTEIGKRGLKLELAKKWIGEILEDIDNRIYFKVLGLNTKLLDDETFGEGSIKKGANYANLYNRFFRTNLFIVKYFFSNKDEIVVDRVFHDNEGNLEYHSYFDWHSIGKLNQEENITCAKNEIVFIDSNHQLEKQYPKVSQVIQLADLLVGCISQCLDYKKSKHKGRDELGLLIYPLVKRILKNPFNKNSSYKYFKKYDISFFPKELPNDFHNLRQYLHRDRILLIESLVNETLAKKTGQQSLF